MVPIYIMPPPIGLCNGMAALGDTLGFLGLFGGNLAVLPCSHIPAWPHLPLTTGEIVPLDITKNMYMKLPHII